MSYNPSCAHCNGRGVIQVLNQQPEAARDGFAGEAHEWQKCPACEGVPTEEAGYLGFRSRLYDDRE